MGTLGIVTGLCAAIFQSFSYLATRHYVQRRPEGAGRSLLVLSHIWMGPVCLAIVLYYWPQMNLNWSQAIWPILGEVAFYLMGQTCLFVALRYAEPSRISSLLSFKLVVLAILATIFWHGGVSLLQWMAVILCVIGGFSLSRSGGAMHKLAIIAMLSAAFVNAMCDWCIGLLLKTFPPETPALAKSLYSMALCYGVCSLIAIPLLSWVKYPAWKDWRGAAPFAGFWLGGMIFLFLCFSYVGPVYGNILQSTRGLISIFLAWVLVRMGAGHIEPAQRKADFYRKLAAGLLMFAAVVLYKLAS